jgi:diguanylate cyclase (GGDEF)-like protein
MAPVDIKPDLRIVHRPSARRKPGASVPEDPGKIGDDGMQGSRHVRILIVDDDDVDRERIRRYFLKAGLSYESIDAESGRQALQLLANQRFDLILLDFQLGDMTGFDLLAELEKRRVGDAPVIMITGGGDETLAVEAMQQGVADYIPKRSLSADTLRLATKNALRMGEVERQLQTAQERLVRLSMYDELTGLPNRFLFFDRLDQFIARAERQGEGFSLLMIDLNLFKHINDYYGHATGDRVLAAVGDRLKEVARKSDTVARLGGDEFACLLADTQTEEELDTCAMKLHDSICQPISIDDILVRVGASIGIARFGLDGKERDVLLARADAAMYEAKTSHRRYALFSRDLGDGQAVTPGCQDLCEGIRSGEFFLEFQPQILLRSDRVVGMEALVRWDSPRFGLIRPDDFIPVAESSGMIKELTCSVLMMGLEQIAEWRAIGLHYPVSFNISARLLDDSDWSDWLAEELTRLQLSSDDLVMEITETAIASSNTNQRQHLRQLSDKGFRLSIDDFGTGFTSFKSIREWRPSELKIDRLFVHDVKAGSSDASIIQSIVTLADCLGIRLVAEGIETREEQEFLIRTGCEFGQGFAIAVPMGAEKATRWLVERQG